MVNWLRGRPGGRCKSPSPTAVSWGLQCSLTGFFHQPFIEFVMVAEANRRRGYGRALVDHCVSLSPAAKVWTSTNESNGAMQALLAKAGFILSGRVDNLDPGDPELIFVHLPRVTPVECAAR